MFTWSLARTTYEVDQLWYIYYHGELLGVKRSNFVIFWSTLCSPTRKQREVITALYLVTIDIDILGVVDKYIYLLLFYKPIQGPSGDMH